MIEAEFYLKDGQHAGFSVKGHAGFSEYGRDIVCAAVTSAVELCVNGITEILKVPASVGSFENEVRLDLPQGEYPEAVSFLKALRLHLELLSQDYNEFIHVTDTEV